MGEAGPGAVAVVLAAGVDVPGFSPGNSRGACGLVDGKALVAPGPAPDFPFVGVDPGPGILPDTDPVEGDDTDGKDEVGAPRGSDPTLLVVA